MRRYWGGSFGLVEESRKKIKQLKLFERGHENVAEVLYINRPQWGLERKKKGAQQRFSKDCLSRKHEKKNCGWQDSLQNYKLPHPSVHISYNA